MIDWNDALNDIVSTLEPDNVPVEYIIMAKYTDHNGIENVVRGQKLKEFMTNKSIEFFEARIIVDVNKIKKFMIVQIVHFFNSIDSKI